MNCLNCGNQLPSDALFCDKCGRKHKRKAAKSEVAPEKPLLSSARQTPEKKLVFDWERAKYLVLELFICAGIFIAIHIAIAMLTPDAMPALAHQLWPSAIFWLATFSAQQLLGTKYQLPKKLHFWLFMCFYFIGSLFKEALGVKDFAMFWLLYEIAVLSLISVFMMWVFLRCNPGGKTLELNGRLLAGYMVIVPVVIYLASSFIYFLSSVLTAGIIEESSLRLLTLEIDILLIVALIILNIIDLFVYEENKTPTSLPETSC